MAYVLAAWSKSSYSHLSSSLYLSRQGTAPSYQIYHTLFRDLQESIISRSVVLVAANDEVQDQILGFCVFEKSEPAILHYVQVKKELWRNGIASELMQSAGFVAEDPCVFTFSSPVISKIKKPKDWIYVPAWLLEKK